jgi:hypothetical protein
MIELRVKRDGEELLSLSLHDSLVDEKTTRTLVSLLKSQMSEPSSDQSNAVTPSQRQFYLRETAPLFILRALEVFGCTFSKDTWRDEFIAYLDTAYPAWTKSVSKATILNYHSRGLRGYGCLAKIHRGKYTLTAEDP